VLTDAGSLEAYGKDWTKKFAPDPTAILLPKDTEEVSKILEYCCEHSIAVVPSGGRTGLAGAAVASNKEIVISLNRLNKIIEVDEVGMSITTQAGVTTQELQETASKSGLLFALDLAAKGSSQIGGNIATNAGGVKFIKHGGAREQVLGLEVVLASGEILNLNTSLRKNNTGYDLKQLFVASEGTLGIITSATLKLEQKPRNLQLALMATKNFARIPLILRSLNKQGASITAFEFFTHAALEKVIQHTADTKSPFSEKANFYVLLEIEEGPISGNIIEPLLEKCFEEELIDDAVISSNSSQFTELWGLRENITESLATNGHVRKNDISLPINRLSDFIVNLEKLISTRDQSGKSNVELIIFGHIGDGNLHINYIASRDVNIEVFNAEARKIEIQVFDLVKKYSGSISAEHGIGLLKKDDLMYSCSELQLSLMKKLKQSFDPKGILNPGKIFDI